MPANNLAKNVDSAFPKYAYTAKPLVAVYDSLKGKKVLANLFIGEWVKILDDPIPDEGRIQVRFRGGTGYVLPDNLTRSRFLEIFFIDVDQGDSILIQTPDDRREGDMLTPATLAWLERRGDTAVPASPYGRLQITIAPDAPGTLTAGTP